MKNPFEKKAQGLNIVIVGCGKVGTTLVERLSQTNNSITVIDLNPEVVQSVTGTYDVMGLTGNGSSYSVQQEAGIENADLIIAVTESDELNLLCCTIAKKVSDCAAIARVRNPDYSEELSYLREQLGISLIINPELETAKEMARLIRLPMALDINSFAKGHAELVRFKLAAGNILDNRKIANINKDFKSDILICAVERGENLVIPDGNYVLKEQDIVSFIATPRNTQSFFKHIGVDTHQAKNCMIIGGGKTSYYLAKELTDMNIGVKIIEMNPKRCEELSVILPRALIIYGDGGDERLLKEEGLDKTEAFVPLTGLDEENILLTLFARKISNTKVITKINRTTFNHVIDELNMGNVIYPRYMTAETILAYVRAMQNSIGNSNVETLYNIFDNRAEALEFRIGEGSKLVGKRIMDLPIKDEVLLACLNRNGKIIIPRGSDVIAGGDRVVIVTKHTGFIDIEDILR